MVLSSIDLIAIFLVVIKRKRTPSAELLFSVQSLLMSVTLKSMIVYLVTTAGRSCMVNFSTYSYCGSSIGQFFVKF